MKSTTKGKLNEIYQCYINIGSETITLNNLPDISDTKSAVYNQEGIIGRSFPLYTYSHSADRTINMQLHFFVVEKGDAARNLSDLKKLQSAVYPRDGSGSGTPYQPPVICKIFCNKLLADEALCAVLQSYSVKFPTEVAWDEETFCPFRFDVDTNWLVVYTSSNLPDNTRIIQSGR
jgi:hypothetical protein